MAFDFPNNPSSGDVVTIGLKQWTFLTGKWLANGISGGGGGASALDDLTDVTITAVSNGQVLKYNGSAWVNAADNTGTTISSIDDITDVTITSASTGQFLKWNGTAWVNDTIDLGTDTSGSFIASLVAGTGVTLTNNSGEAATPTITLDATLDNLSNVTVPSPTTNDVLQWNGTAWVNAVIPSSGSTVSETPPSSPTTGQVWYESDTGKTFVYYDSFWVEIVGSTGAQGPEGPEGGSVTLTTKGDLLTRSASALSRLPVGATNGHVLTVDSAETSGMKWAASSGGGGDSISPFLLMGA